MKKQKKGSSNISYTTVTIIYYTVFVGVVIVAIPFAMIGIGLHQDSFAQSQRGHNVTTTIPTTVSNSTTTNAATPSTISLPLSKGFVNGRLAYFIATDASSNQIVSSVSNTTSFNVNYAPSLANTSESSRQQGYVFINGLKGEGPLGSQLSVASALPEDKGYSPLFQINYVKWNSNATKDIRILKSVDEILIAQKMGELTITKSNAVINSPVVSLKSP
jgi:hypothetical protein